MSYKNSNGYWEIMQFDGTTMVKKTANNKVG
jgi:hypothetical protein